MLRRVYLGRRAGRGQRSPLNGPKLALEGEIYAITDGNIRSHIPNGSLCMSSSWMQLRLGGISLYPYKSTRYFLPLPELFWEQLAGLWDCINPLTL